MSFNNINVNNINVDDIESLAANLELVMMALDSRSLIIPEDLSWIMTNILMTAKKVIQSYPVERYKAQVTEPISVVKLGGCYE